MSIESSTRRERAIEWIRQLTHFRPRFAGTPSELAAAEAIGRWLQQLGFEEVTIQPVPGAPRPGLVLSLHAALAWLAVVVGGTLGALLSLITAWSFASEVRRRVPRLSRILPAPPSRNVVARRGPPQPAQRVVLSAHIDAAQAGFFFSRRFADFFAGLAQPRQERNPPVGPMLFPEVAILGAAVLCTAGWFGAQGWVLGLARLLLLLSLSVIALGTLQWAFAAGTPGANDNASAVAAMLLAGERLVSELPSDVELWLVGTGAEEVGCCGMQGLLGGHREWPTTGTWFVNFECVGGGNLHYVESEGLARKTQYPAALTELARRFAESGQLGEVSPTHLMAGTDGNVPARLGYPTLSLISLEPNGVPRNYHRREDTVENIDGDMVVRAADLGAEVVLAAVRGACGPLPAAPAVWQEPY